MLVESPLLSPLPCLASLKNRDTSRNVYGGPSVGEAGNGLQTPTSSSDPTSERIDPVLLLSRPVEGFNHPRQHLFTDRLLGRFYEDSSLDAETRKNSKCLAGRLGTAGSSSTTRPNTTATTTSSHLRASRSPTTTRRGGKRMRGSASAPAVGGTRESGGLAERKAQVQREILEQKALIEKLEGRVASLSGRAGRSPAPRGSSAPLREDREGGTIGRRDDADDRPTTTPQPESAAARGGRDEEYAGDGSSAVQNQMPAEGRGGRAYRLSERGGDTTANQSRRASAKSARELPDHGPNARRDSLRQFSGITAQEEKHAVTIQRNVRGSGRRKKFLTLQSAREDLERHLQALVSAITTALVQQQQQQQQRTPEAGVGGESGSSNKRRHTGDEREGRLKNASAAVVRLLETSREDGLAKPPFEILQAMYRGLDGVTGALASLSLAAAGEEEADPGTGAGGDGGKGGSPCTASMVESCGAAQEVLDAIREAVGADVTAFGGRANLPGPPAGSSTPPVVHRHHQSSPAGSGRAAVVAMSSSRGGLLVPPDESPAVRREPMAGNQSGEDNGAGGGGQGHLRPVPLRTLDVRGITALLRMHDLEEHVPGFVAQGVDGVMLSDPNLCEADFVELGIAGGDEEGARSSRARIVSLFRRCQRDGVILSATGGSPSPSSEGRVGLSSHPCSSVLDDQLQTRPSAGRSPRESTEGSSWRRGSALVDRENQRVLAQISLDPSETSMSAGGSTVAAGGGAGDGRRMSVSLIQGVVVTADGREAGLVDNAEGLSAIEAEEAEESGAAAGLSRGGSSAATTRGRRTSLGLPAITLCRESDLAGDGGGAEADEDLPIPPGVTVSAADTTVNVYR